LLSVWTGLFGFTEVRTDGSRQLIYNGHPLCTYIGAAPRPGQGNNLNLNGDLWHEVRVSP
jgi:hypothetical protein